MYIVGMKVGTWGKIAYSYLAKALPKEFFQKCADSGLLPIAVGTPWPTKVSATFLLLDSKLLQVC